VANLSKRAGTGVHAAFLSPGTKEQIDVKTIAVIANNKKTLGGGLEELRQMLFERGYPDPMWLETSKGREVGKLARDAVARGATLLFIWGGDGTVQRCVNAVVDRDVELAILPAGTANLLALNLDIPFDLAGALEIGLAGTSRRLDVGVMNGKCFAVMAGIGFDAITMQQADGDLKERFGRLAYLWTGFKALRVNARHTKIRVDGKTWFKGNATCVLFGQMKSVAKGIAIFPESQPDDGVLEVGVVTAESARQWLRVIAQMAIGNAKHSPFTKMTQGRHVEVHLDRASRFELDGGAKASRRTHQVSVKPGAITLRVPSESSS